SNSEDPTLAGVQPHGDVVEADTTDSDVEHFRFKPSTAITRRLDQYLVDRVPYLSRARVQRLIVEDLCTVTGEPTKASDHPKAGEAHWRLARKFENRTIQKTYLAVVHGVPELLSDVIDLPIGRDRYIREKQAIRKEENGGRPAVTQYEILETFSGPAKAILHA